MEASQLLDLPYEMLLSISGHLPALALLHFHGSCQRLRALPVDSHWRSL